MTSIRMRIQKQFPYDNNMINNADNIVLSDDAKTQ